MYIVIVCVNCNGSSQVEEEVLGKVVQCPLCDKPTVARTQMAVLPVAKPIDLFTMSPVEASVAARMIGARTVVPVQHRLGRQGHH